MRSKGKVEVVGLRPSIVFGPRSRWCSDLAGQALKGTAYFLREGSGICNTIYIDNLVEAIVQAAQAPGVDGHYFLVRDRETITWKDFYKPILEACGTEPGDVHEAEAPAFRPSWQDHLGRWRGSPLLQKIKPLVPPLAIRVGKAALQAVPAPSPVSPWPDSRKPLPHVTAEMAALQQCTWRMPCAKAEKMLGYQPKTSFSEGMKRSIGWLKFAGYPLKIPAP
jgi:nucleoside-diphosphate-sugar epimerase